MNLNVEKAKEIIKKYDKIKRWQDYLEELKENGKENLKNLSVCGLKVPDEMKNVLLDGMIYKVEKEINRLKEELDSIEITIRENCND